jgi:hypothetical protein
MPAVKKGEKRSAYVKRAVKQLVEKEGMSPKAAVGKAEGMFDSKWKGPKKRSKPRGR